MASESGRTLWRTRARDLLIYQRGIRDRFAAPLRQEAEGENWVTTHADVAWSYCGSTYCRNGVVVFQSFLVGFGGFDLIDDDASVL